MMKTGKKAHQITRSATLALNEKARQLAHGGKDVIHLGIGEPLNDAPSSAIRYSQDKLATKKIKYGPTAGLPSLKESIRKYTKQHYGREPAPANIIITSGAKQSLHNLLYAILNPGDEVLLFSPYWVSYPEMVKLAYGDPRIVPPGEDLVPGLEATVERITPNTKAIILNSPNNPSGVVYPPEVIAGLVDLCEDREIFLIMDDIYHRLVFEDAKWVPGYVFTSNPIDQSYVIVINGISKSFGMTGFRIGWTVGPEPIISTMSKIQSHTTSGASVLLQEAARGALDDGESAVQELKAFIDSNRRLILSALRDIPGVKVIEPGGAFYCLPDFSAYRESSQELAEFLLENTYVVTVPGSAFGLEGHLRLSYTCSPEDITESMQRIRWALDGDAPPTMTIGAEEHTCDWERKRVS